MINKQFISNLPTERLLRMLGSQEERTDVWTEMEPENHEAGRGAYSPYEDKVVIEYVANVLGKRIDEARGRRDDDRRT